MASIKQLGLFSGSWKAGQVFPADYCHYFSYLNNFTYPNTIQNSEDKAVCKTIDIIHRTGLETDDIIQYKIFCAIRVVMQKANCIELMQNLCALQCHGNSVLVQ